MIQFTLSTSETGQKTLTVFANGKLHLPVDNTHPNFTAILGACQAHLAGEDVDEVELVDLFDIAAVISRKFQRLSERVTVDGNNLCFDGDPVEGILQDQILAFLDAGEDVEPLVNFWEKLSDNPLGNVRAGLFDWIVGQQADGNFTIASDGDIYGYKGFNVDPEGYYPSRDSRDGGEIIGDRVLKRGERMHQNLGQTVEMPRSLVLNEPSSQCGHGLHIGTWNYAKGFAFRVVLVKFSPRDIVSLPDSNSAWKLRVSRYTLIDEVTESLEGVVYDVAPKGDPFDDEQDDDLDLDDIDLDDLDLDDIEVGDEITDDDGDVGIVMAIYLYDDALDVDYSGNTNSNFVSSEANVLREDVTSVRRKRTYSGPTSEAAKGRGRNPAQDAKGRFSAGRPASARDASTGRFA